MPVKPNLAGPCALAVAAVLAGPRAWGQQVPSAGAILRQQEQAAPRRIDQLPPTPAEEAVRPVLRGTGGVHVTLKTVRFTGGQGLVPEGELQALVRSSLGQSLDLAQLQALADKVTQALKDKGWFLARAYLPEQDLTEGTLEIAILAGRLDGGLDGIVVVADGVRLDEARIRATLAGALSDVGSQGLNVAHLERALLLLNDLPGVSAQSSLEKGRDAGSTKLTVTVREKPVVSALATGDNFGNRYTGEVRAAAQVQWSDPWGRGDQFGLSALASQGIAQGAASYSLPLGAQGLRLALSGSSLHYKIGADLAALGLSGDARTAGASLSYPLVLSTRFNLRAGLGADLKALTDESSGIRLRDRRLASVTASLSGDAVDTWHGGGFNLFGVALSQGHADLGRVPSDLAADQLGPGTQGSYTKATWSLARLQKLPGAWTAYGSFSGQASAKNLDSAEKFVLGGNAGVRAYPAGEGAGDAGWLASAELRYDMAAPAVYGNLQWFAFVDTGRVTLNHSIWGPGAVTNATGSNSYQLSGAGIGVALNRAEHHSVRMFYAHALGDNPGRSTTGNYGDGRARRGRLLLTATFYL